MSHIFISYSKKDIEFARHLRQLLQEQGFAVWMDEAQIDIGEDWFAVIRNNVLSSSAVILVVSPNFTQSKWVRREFLIADNNGNSILPVLLSGKPWDEIGEIQHEDMTAGLHAKLSPAFIAKLKQIVPTEHQPLSPSPNPIQRTRPIAQKSVWLISLLALILIAGFVVIFPFLRPNTSIAPKTDVATFTETTDAIVSPTLDRVAVTSIPSVTPATAQLKVTVDPFVKVTSNAIWKQVIHVESIYGVEVAMVLVPAGCFRMGGTDEQVKAALDGFINNETGEDKAKSYVDGETPMHRVCFDQPFWIDQYEVTNEQYGSEGIFKGAKRPRESITWADAEAFCEQRHARLPTEAEWEYAARGPDGLVYPWGNEFIAENAVYASTSSDQSAEVGTKPNGVSWVGAYDMAGNVWEWVADWYGPYIADTQVNPQGPQSGSPKVMRGGSWNFYDNGTRTYIRFHISPVNKYDFLGFRCARDYQ